MPPTPPTTSAMRRNKKAAAAAAELTVASTTSGTAQAQVTAAKAQLRFAQLQLEYTKVVAPESGKVTKKNVESGASSARAASFCPSCRTSGGSSRILKEVQLEHMRDGQSVEVRVDSYPGTAFRGRVQSLQAGTGVALPNAPAGKRHRQLGEVVQRLPVEDRVRSRTCRPRALAQGMSVEVTVTRADRASRRGAMTPVLPCRAGWVG